jgi:hypothetical protein
LSCLFWGLPIALLISVPGVPSQWLVHVGWGPRVLATGLLLFGVWQLGSFQRQERIWVSTHGRAQAVALVNVGLSPFLFWCERAPQLAYFQLGALMFHLGLLLFLALLNSVLERLTSMLPDETLRTETRLFAGVNRWLVLLLLAAASLFHAGINWTRVADQYPRLLEFVGEYPSYFIMPFVLIAIALTMAVIWKTKQVILDSVFGGQH